MKALWFTIVFCVSIAPFPSVNAQVPRADAEGVEGARGATVKATVEAVDVENRIVTLKGPKGDIRAIRVGDEVRNLSQLAPGDVVEIEYYEAVALDVKKTDAAPTATETRSITRSKPGDKPGGKAKRKVHLVTEVMSINPESQSLVVRGPMGHMTQIKVNDPARLAELEVGNRIEVTYIEGLAIAVSAAPKEK